MLLLPEVTATTAAALPLVVPEHEKIVGVMLIVNNKKRSRGCAPSDLWLSLVKREIDWSVKYWHYLTYPHRCNVCDLLEWLVSQTGWFPDCWSLIVPRSQNFYRAARAELDWCAANLNKLSPRRRDDAVDLLEMFCAENPEEFHSSWRSLLA